MNRERPDHTLQTTILVDEAYLQLVNQEDRNWQSRSHFFAVAAQLMRRILIDHARSRNAAKRGGGPRVKVPLDDVVVLSNDKCEELILVDRALARLFDRDPRLGRIVELKFFAGMTDEEVGEVLGLSARQIKRDWSVARTWLHGELSIGKSDDGGTMGPC
jgi:RNA polymerase sigma factor (TIGR02999 family)